MAPSRTAMMAVLLVAFITTACASPVTRAQPTSTTVLHQAYNVLLDDYVDRLDPTVLALGATTGMTNLLASRGISLQPADLPSYGNESRVQTWDTLQQSYTKLSTRYGSQVSARDLAYAAIRQMAASVDDCHTLFSDPRQLATEQAQLSGTTKFGGIGAFLLDRPGQPPAIREVFSGGPAAKAGVIPGDIIRQVGKQDVSTMPARNVANLIRGPQGTPVTLTLERRGGVLQQVTITREQVAPPIANGSIFTFGQVHIAYLHIYSFPTSLMAVIDPMIQQIEQDHVQGWVIDLRENGGGELSVMQQFASRFLSRSPLDQMLNRQGKITLLPTSGTVVAHARPLAVIVNQDSASASEMFAAAVQEQQAGPIIGTRTAGCLGVAREVLLADGSGMQVKFENVLTGLHGIRLNGNGITPDDQITLTVADLTKGIDPQLNAAVGYDATQLGASGKVRRIWRSTA